MWVSSVLSGNKFTAAESRETRRFSEETRPTDEWRNERSFALILIFIYYLFGFFRSGVRSTGRPLRQMRQIRPPSPLRLRTLDPPNKAYATRERKIPLLPFKEIIQIDFCLLRRQKISEKLAAAPRTRLREPAKRREFNWCRLKAIASRECEAWMQSFQVRRAACEWAGSGSHDFCW